MDNTNIYGLPDVAEQQLRSSNRHQPMGMEEEYQEINIIAGRVAGDIHVRLRSPPQGSSKFPPRAARGQ